MGQNWSKIGQISWFFQFFAWNQRVINDEKLQGEIKRRKTNKKRTENGLKSLSQRNSSKMKELTVFLV